MGQKFVYPISNRRDGFFVSSPNVHAAGIASHRLVNVTVLESCRQQSRNVFAFVPGRSRDPPAGEPGGGMCVSPVMRDCRKTDPDCGSGPTDSKTAKVLAPEDVRAGDYVALLHEVHEILSFWWCGGIGTIRPDDPVRIPFIPKNGGVPFRVRSVCLPFILVKAPSGKVRSLDVRRYRLARLDRTHALVVWKACKKSRRKRTQVATK